MKQLTIVVEASDGKKAEASLTICDCDGESFYVFIIDGHQHLQCTECELVYCSAEGPCSDEFVM